MQSKNKTLHSGQSCRSRRPDEAGFTLVELMVAAVVITSGMVVILGFLVTLIAHSQGADAKVAAVQFQRSVLEDIRARAELNQDVLDYTLPFPTNPDGTIFIASLGLVNVSVEGVLPPGGGGNPTYFDIPVGNGFDKLGAPQQIEIRVRLDVDTGPMDGIHTFSGVVDR